MKKEIINISVLIPTMNRPETLRKTLESYLLKSVVPSQIVIVDQSDTDETKVMIESIRENDTNVDLDYVYQDQKSLTLARNRALSMTKNDVVICSDDDIDVHDETVKNVFQIMTGDNVALIAGIDERTKHSSTNIGYLLGTKSYGKRHKGHVTLSVLGRYPDEINKETSTEWAMGYFFAIRKSLVEKWNLRWDENLTGYAYAEDLDFSYSYCKQARKEQMKCVLTPKVTVQHLASTEYRTASRKSTMMYTENRVYISHKHHMGLKSRIAIMWCDIWRLIERLVRKQQAKDLLDAIIYSTLHSKEIKEGRFNYLV